MALNPASTLALDWLQGVCTYSTPNRLPLANNYTQVRTDIHTRNFQYQDNIFDNEGQVAIINYQPCSPIIPKDCYILKFHNSYLYRPFAIQNIRTFLAINNIVWKNTTRIDICSDFNFFLNELSPERFVARLKQDIYLECAGRLMTNYFKQSRKTVNSGITFGSNQSDVKTTLYNKGYEMSIKTWKEYIWESWLNTGLDINKDTWRLEFRINNCRRKLYSTETGEEISLHNLQWLKEDYIKDVFAFMTVQYFTFKINNYKKNKSRMKKKKLLNINNSNFNASYLINNQSNSLEDKKLINRLNKHAEEQRAIKGTAEDYTLRALREYVTAKGLTKWAREKGIQLY